MKGPGDADDFASVPAVQAPGPLFARDWFAGSRQEATPVERVVAGIIMARGGWRRAIAAREVCEAVGVDDRTVRGVVEQLIVAHGLRIGSSVAGYYAIETAEDLEMAVGRYRSQMVSMSRRLRVLMGKHELVELLGQLGLEE